MLGGNDEIGRTELKTDVTFPVAREMTMVAEVSRPEIIALEEASTVIASPVDPGLITPIGGDRGGVG